jgi:sodium transport system permease protein
MPYLIIILCFTGAMYPAMDLTAGEKERGTMETLLCSPVARVDLVLGKFLMVLTGSLRPMMCSRCSRWGHAVIGGMLSRPGAAAGEAAQRRPQSGRPRGHADDRSAGAARRAGDGAAGGGAVSAVIFTVALFAKSYKEAQSYVSPLIIVVIMPAMMGMLPGIDLNARLALVPILNLSLVCKECSRACGTGTTSR